jgi:hypothetical protein
MTSATLWRYTALIAGGIFVSSCYVATHYDGWRYQGGRIMNYGLFSRPRFEAPLLPSLPLNVPGRYEFRFSRFPADDAYVILTVPGGTSVRAIESLATQVRIRLIDQNDQVKCDATGSPRGKGSAQLVVTSSADVDGLWHTECARLQLRACDPCRLEIIIGPTDPETPAISVTATLRGGGFELP